MSYDILFRRLRFGLNRGEVNTRLASEDVDVVLEEAFEPEDGDGEPASEEDVQRRARAVSAIRDFAGPAMTVFEAPDGTELLVEELGLDISLGSRSAGISIAYWNDGEKIRTTASIVLEVCRIVEREMGLVPYDPQLGRILDPDRDSGELRQLYGFGVSKTKSISHESGLDKGAGCAIFAILLFGIIAIIVFQFFG